MDFSPEALMASLLVSSVGFSLFLYGKKQLRAPQLVVGLALMGFPYFVGEPLFMLGISGGLGLALIGALRAGY